MKINLKKGFVKISVATGILLVTILVVTAVISFPKSVNACGNGWFQNPCSSNAKQLDDMFARQSKLVNAIPAPQMETSLERKNIVKRAEIFNVENKVSYIYLINYGKVMAFYTIKGKVSSVSSYLVPQEQLVYGDGSKCSWGSSGACYTVQAPDIDGSYGTNGEGIFFFTTDGVYVEWKGDYMLVDQPLQLSTQPEMVRVVK